MGNLPLGSGWKMSKNIWVATTWDLRLVFFLRSKKPWKTSRNLLFFLSGKTGNLESRSQVQPLSFSMVMALSWSDRDVRGPGAAIPSDHEPKIPKTPSHSGKMNMEPKVMGFWWMLGRWLKPNQFLSEFFSGEPCENFQGWFHRVTTNTPIFQSPGSQTVHHRTPRFENPQPSRGLKFWT